MGMIRKVVDALLLQEGAIVQTEGESDNDFRSHLLRDKTFVDWLIVTSNKETVKFSFGERVGSETHFKFSAACSRDFAESFLKLMARSLDMDVVKREN